MKTKQTYRQGYFKLAALLLASLFLALFVACGDDGEGENTPASETTSETEYTWIVDSATASQLGFPAGTYKIKAKSDKTFTTTSGENTVASGTWILTGTTLSATVTKKVNSAGTALEDVTGQTLTFTVGANNSLTLMTGGNGSPTTVPGTDNTTTYTWVLDAALSSLLTQSSALPDMDAGTYTFKIEKLAGIALFDIYKSGDASGARIMGGSISPNEDDTSVQDFCITEHNGETKSYTKPLSFTVGANNVLTFVKPKFTVEFAKDGASSDMRDEIYVTLGEKATRPANPTKADYYTEEELSEMSGLPGFNVKYEFKNWSTALEENAESYDFDTPIVDDTVIYAHWKEIYYSPVNNMNADTITVTPSGLVAEGSTVTFTVTPPAGRVLREGYPKVEYYNQNDDTNVGLSEVAITQVDGSTTTWTFTMPNSAVNISAEYDGE